MVATKDEDLEDALAAKQALSEQLDRFLRRADHDIANLKRQVADGEAELAEHRHESSKAARAAKELLEQVQADFVARVTEKNRDIEALEANLAARNSELANTQSDLDAVSSQLQKAETALAAAAGENEHVKDSFKV